MATPAPQEQLFMQSPLRFLTASSFEALSNKERYSIRFMNLLEKEMRPRKMCQRLRESHN